MAEAASDQGQSDSNQSGLIPEKAGGNLKGRHLRSFLLSVLLFLVAAGAGLMGSTWLQKTRAAESCFQAGLAAFRENDLETLEILSESLRGLPRWEPHASLLEGLLFLRAGRWVEAIERFGFAREHPQTQALAYAHSGDALYQLGRFAEAIRILTIALQMDPKLADARRYLAAAYYDIGAMNHAIDELERLSQLVPDDYRPYRLIGLIYRDFDEVGKASVYYQKALECSPPPLAAEAIRLELAGCLTRQQRFAEAAAILASCEPSPEALALQADCARAQGEKNQARALLEKTLKMAPCHERALVISGQLALEENDSEEAVRFFQKYVECYPKQWRAHFQLAQAYQRVGKKEEAELEFEQMRKWREIQRQFTDLHEKAMRDLHGADIRFELARLAEELDRPDLARMWLAAALGLDPNHKEAQLAWARLQKAGVRGSSSPGGGSEVSLGESLDGAGGMNRAKP